VICYKQLFGAGINVLFILYKALFKKQLFCFVSKELLILTAQIYKSNKKIYYE